MYIKTLKLNNYRNITTAAIDFHDGVNIIYGDNAQGKTNILESIYFTTAGRSHRTRADRETVNFTAETANIKNTYMKNGFKNSVDIYLKKDDKKGIALNGAPIKKIGELFGEFYAILFTPIDMSIINDSPTQRRKFIDIQICQIDKLYYYHLQSYFNVLKQRNLLLKNKRDISETLDIWDLQLVEHGRQIIKIRDEYIEKLKERVCDIHRSITDGKEMLQVQYRPSAAADDFYGKLKKYAQKDILYGQTSVGPHKDDIVFAINSKESRAYGSQGQKRTIILALKLASVAVIKEEINDTPVLLLDDALSELDSKRQNMLIKYIGGMQTIITATGMEDIVANLAGVAKVFRVESGNITAE